MIVLTHNTHNVSYSMNNDTNSITNVNHTHNNNHNDNNANHNANINVNTNNNSTVIVHVYVYVTVPQKGYAKRGSNRQITKSSLKSLLSHLNIRFSWNPI